MARRQKQRRSPKSIYGSLCLRRSQKINSQTRTSDRRTSAASAPEAFVGAVAQDTSLTSRRMRKVQDNVFGDRTSTTGNGIAGMSTDCCSLLVSSNQLTSRR